ncbi:MAG: methyltransferase domain-containing protein [Xanthobacteraceae bacterium]|nr:methyltransferase domain-containing protein [Xanthobacteraceae bacterium]MCW5677929.1 methyltransferase domain-containing protein [Xanthobacteraceae bacterium]
MSAPHILFDRKLLRARQRRARHSGAEAFLLERASEDLLERLGTIARKFSRAAVIDTPEAENLKTKLLASGRVETADILAIDDETEVVSGDPAAYDLAVSLLSMQWLNDLPGVLAQIKRILKPDGLLLAAMIGGDALTELRDALASAESETEGGISPRVSPFVEVRTLGSLLQRAGLALPVTDIDRVTVRYANAFELMRDLRRMGAANALTERSRKPLKRTTLLRAAEIYRERYAGEDGRIRATFEILWLSGWVPHESQQQPLRPGSAKTRLADALRAVELPAGDKTGRKKNE